ncbi:ArsR family transcriptional regulator [Pseudaminobacter arsenicus]|uniref:ArsR family transcriptional regulator n=1 Tax=Borborobacter arsenicus TaxID=1851146 RepID=A0A432V6B4_9HYPH|nr:metalloregulator ArsR/SmtB family transcription factor [Pseudaminobacter arsenicus]RUM97712.1 ArsR family transcriptional regulator [Pseudaminobacter arsenicus]
MDEQEAIDALSALAQQTRLDAFRQLVAAEPEGMAAGDLARLLDIPQNTLSAHLAILTRVGLTESRRQSRSIIYRAKLSTVRDLTLFLLKDCCHGRSEICAPLLAELNPCLDACR